MIDSDVEEASEVRLASSQGSQGIEAQFKKKERIRLIMDYYSISFEEVSVRTTPNSCDKTLHTLLSLMWFKHPEQVHKHPALLVSPVTM